MIGAVLRIRYELKQELEEDALFQTFLARDRVAGKDVRVRIVKPPHASETMFVDRLRQVVGESKGIHHEALERLLDVDDDEGRPFLVSENPPGRSLRERIKKLAPFSAPLSTSVAIKIAEALSALHAAGKAHGDLRPENILATQDGGVRLLLPGVWEAYSSSSTAGKAVIPMMAPYLAPEVTAGQMPSPQSDVYALGVVLYELVSGRKPFTGDMASSIAHKHATAPPPSLRAINPAIPFVLEEIVKKALAKSPADRYPDARAILSDLRVLHDAMRFGKPLSWPLRAAATGSTPRVAPQMGAVRPEIKETKVAASEDADREDRVARWLVGAMYAAAAVVLVMVGGWLYWNFTKPSAIEVPNVVGLSVNEAKNRLAEMNLELRVTRRVADEEKTEGTVLSVNPAPGEQVREGAAVNAVVSRGSRFVFVPDLAGLSTEQARERLQSLDLALDELIEEVANDNLPKGRVVSQTPAANSKVERLSKVRVTASLGPSTDEPETPERPSAARSLFRLSITMPATDVPIQVRVDMDDGRGTRTVYERSHQSNDQFVVETQARGREATFRIYFDDELVDERTEVATDEENATE